MKYTLLVVLTCSVFGRAPAVAGVLTFDTDRNVIARGEEGGFWESVSAGVNYGVTNGELVGEAPSSPVEIRRSAGRLAGRFNLDEATAEMPAMTGRFDEVHYGALTLRGSREYQGLDGPPGGEPPRVRLDWELALPPLSHEDGNLVPLERHLATDADTGGPLLGPIVVGWELVGTTTLHGESVLDVSRVQSRGKLTLPQVVTQEGWDSRGAHLVQRFDYYFIPQSNVFDEQIDGIGVSFSMPRITYSTWSYGLPVPEPSAFYLLLTAALGVAAAMRHGARPARS